LAQDALVFRTVLSTKAVVCSMPWGCTEAAPLCVMAFVAYMAVLVALEALSNNAVPFEWLAIVQLVLPD
jgi:hypothetical protein